jgi:hypothetical protein
MMMPQHDIKSAIKVENIRSSFLASRHTNIFATFHQLTPYSEDMIASKPLVPGIYAPLPTFYLDGDEQDLGEFLVAPPVLRSA